MNENSRRLVQLESQVRWLKRCVVALVLGSVAILATAAAQPQKFVELVCGSVEIKNATGKTTAKVFGAGDAEFVGKLTAGKLAVGDADVGSLKVKGKDIGAAVEAAEQVEKQLAAARPLKATSFRVIFHSQDVSAKDAREPANEPNSWTLYMLPKGDFPGYLHPTKLGKKVVAVWWAPVRGLYDFSKWGVIHLAGDGNQVRVSGSALANAGRIEAVVHVLYEE